MVLTPSRRQLRRREAGWEGSRVRSRDPRNTWRVGAVRGLVSLRVEGGTARASQQYMAKPDVIKGPLRRRGGCAMKVAGLIRGDLRGCSRCPVLLVRGVVRDGGVKFMPRAAMVQAFGSSSSKSIGVMRRILPSLT